MTFAEQVGDLRRTLHRALKRRLAGETPRPLNQLLALRSIAEFEVQLQAELSDRLLMDAASVSRLVDLLEREGLLRRCEGADRRSVRLEVTAAAQKDVERVRAALQWLDAQVRSLLSASELSMAKKLLEKVQRGFKNPSATPWVAPDSNGTVPRGSRGRAKKAGTQKTKNSARR